MESVILDYEETVREIREERIDKYFDRSELLEDIHRDQSLIAKVLQEWQDRKIKKQRLIELKKKYLTVHPLRSTVQLATLSHNDKQNQNIQNHIQNSNPQINTEYTLHFLPRKLSPIKKPYSNSQTFIPPSPFTLLSLHWDQHASTHNLHYTPLLNLHHSHHAKMRSVTLRHQITQANVHIKQGLFSEKIQFYCVREDGLVFAEGSVQWHEIQEVKEIGFRMVGCQEVIFVMRIEMKVERVPLAPDLRDLAAMLPPKKVLSKSPERSPSHRSPSRSPTKRLAKTVSSPPPQFFQILHNQQITLSLTLSSPLLSLETKPTIQKQENISNHSFEVMESHHQKIKIRALIECKDESVGGHVWITIGRDQFYFKAQKDTRFKVLKVQDYRGEQGVGNQLVALTENCYVRPQPHAIYSRHPVEQTATLNTVSTFFIKTDTNQQDPIIYCHPLHPSSINLKKGETGYTICFIITDSDISQLPAASLKHPKQPQPQSPTKNQQQEHIKSIHLTFSLCRSDNKGKKYYELHYVLCHVRQQKVEMSLEMQVRDIGGYYLNFGGVLRKGARYRVRSSDSSRLKVELECFQEGSINQHYPIRLCKSVELREWVLLFLDDLEKSMTCVIKVDIVQGAPEGIRYK